MFPTFVACLAWCGCMGSIGTGDQAQDPAKVTPTTTVPPAGVNPGVLPGASPDPTGSPSAAFVPLRRLTREQYANTARDLMGIKEDVTTELLPNDEAAIGFRSNIIAQGLTRTLHSLGGDHERGTAGLYTGARLNPGSGFGGGGYASGPSVDQILARALPKQTDFASLEFGVQSLRPNEGNAMNYISYAASNQPLLPEGSPYKAFDRLFGGVGGTGPDGLAQLRANRRSVIDLVKSEIVEVQTRVGRADRTKLEAHLEATRAIERRLQAGTSGTCPVVKPGGSMDINANANFPSILKLQTDLLVAAFACDRTRIATLMWSRGFRPTYHTWAGASEHHGQSHTDQRGPLAAVDRWYMGQFAYLLEAMKKVPEGNGTPLDNTLVVYCNELNEGRFHKPGPTPTVLAGRLGGTIRTARFIDYGANAPQNHSQLLVTLLHAMGLTNVDRVGDLGPAGRLPNLLT